MKLFGSCQYEKDDNTRTHNRGLNVLPDDDVEELRPILASEMADDVTSKNGRIVPDSIKMWVES